MEGYSTNIEARTLDNGYFREVLFTAPHCQLVVMTLQPLEEIGLETHEHGDQFIRVESGEGLAVIDGRKHLLFDGAAVVIPEGTAHNIVNTSSTEPLRLYTLYSPPQHPEGTVHRTKAEADRAEQEHHALH